MLPPSSASSSTSSAAPLTGSPEAQVVSQAQLKRERLRFVDFHFTRTQSGQCTAEVELEWIDNVRVSGTASGQSSPMGDLRIAAEAGLRALETFTEGQLQLELIGIKAMRAFDANIVIVSVGVLKGDGPRKLLGCYLAERDPIRASVVAVLNATNRLLGNFIATR